MNFQELIEAKLRVSRNVSLNHFISLVENQTINKENFNEFIEILKKYDRFDEIENYSNLIKSVQKHIDLNFKITDENDKCFKNCEEKIGYEYKNEEEDKDDEEYEDDYDEDENYDEDAKTDLSALNTFEELDEFFESLARHKSEIRNYDINELNKALDRHLGHVENFANAKVTERLHGFLKKFSKFTEIRECLIQICEYHKETRADVEDILNWFFSIERKIYPDASSPSYYMEGAYFGTENEDLLVRKSFYEFFIEKLKELKVSKTDLYAILNVFYLETLVACDNRMYSYHNYDKQIDEINKIYFSNNKPCCVKPIDKIELNQFDLDEFKSDICEVLRINEEIIDNYFKLNLFVNELLYSDDVFCKFDDDQKLELAEILQNNEVARNRLSQIVENHLESNYDFDSLMQYLKKKEKKTLLNI